MKIGEVMSIEEKGYGKFQWFFFVIFIPSIFAIVLFVIILSILGFNVLEKAKNVGSNIPVISKYINEDEEEEQINIEDLYVQIAEQEEQINLLTRQLEQKEEEIKDLTNEATNLGEQLDEREEEVIATQKDLKEIAKTYEAMSTKNAANILSELNRDEALLHLSQIKIDVRAAILAKMEPELAADLMSRLANQ